MHMHLFLTRQSNLVMPNTDMADMPTKKTETENDGDTSQRLAIESALLWLGINGAQRRILHTTERKLRAENLPSLHWFDILWTLMAKAEPMRPQALEAALNFEQSKLSRTLAAMEKSGEVKVKTFAGDRRGKLVEVTAKGENTARRIWKVYGPLLVDLLAKPMQGQDIVGLAHLMWKVADSDPPFDLDAGKTDNDDR